MNRTLIYGAKLFAHLDPSKGVGSPKDGDLCLNRVKPGETLVEARSDTDVQIVRLIWV